MGKKKRSLFTFSKTQVHKKTVTVATPLLPNFGVILNFAYLQTKNIDVEQRNIT